MIGDAKCGVVTLGPSETYEIKPSAYREEWIVTNLYTTGEAKFEITDGSSAVVLWSPTGPGSLRGESIHITQSYYIKLAK